MTKMMTEQEIYKEALKKWGDLTQILMMVEECSELQKIICKGYRKGLNSVYPFFVEELVDVQIMIEQMKILLRDRYTESFDSEWESQYEKKLRRLEQMLRG
jgi:NTP pyrophosphatase (non-canonical NTP hydrolase)